MLRGDFYLHKRKMALRAYTRWIKGFIFLILMGLFLTGVAFSLQNGTAKQIIPTLSDWHLPMELILLEGAPGLSAPEREHLSEIRSQGIATGMFLLTGANISDPRTFFLSFFSPPPDGPEWLAWAYNPKDPEFEGTILELLEENGKSDEVETAPGEDEPSLNGNSNGETLVGIYNTHNSESYSGDGGKERETGKNGDVVTVGGVLCDTLNQKGIGAVQSKTIHDAKDFMKAYTESIKTAQKLLDDYPTIKMLIDVHRDGFPPGVAKATTVIDGEKASQVRVVIGQKNTNWKKNETLALELMALAEEKYPGLFAKTITYAEDARYNQHLSEGAILIEIGSQFNTLEESKRAAKAVGDIIAQWFQKQNKD